MKTDVVIALAVVVLSQFTWAETNFSDVQPMVPPLSVAPPRWLDNLFYFYSGAASPDFHIAGGPEAARHAQSHQVALTIREKDKKISSFCSGSLISDLWILTAGHCVKDAFYVTATLGKHNIYHYESTQQSVDVETIVVHPDYTKNLRNDIALLKLLHNVDLDGKVVDIIRLPSESQKDETFYGYYATMTGWGRDSDKSNKLSPVLRSVDSWVVSNFYCGFRYFLKIPSSQICVSGYRGKGTSRGDSGGPLYIVEGGTKTLIGIASWNYYKCEWSWPPVFTRVTSYLNWIYEVTGISPRT